MKRFLLLLVLLLPLSTAPTFAEAPNKSNTFMDSLLPSQCGAEDVIRLRGMVHIDVRSSFGAGRLYLEIRTHMHDVKGIGLITGNQYVVVGGESTRFDIPIDDPSDTSEVMYVHHFQILTAGRGNNYRVKYNTHITVDAAGNVLTGIDHLRAECK